MTIVKLGITMSAVGYVAGQNQSCEHPLGERGKELHQWAFAEMEVHVVPMLLGSGSRLFDNLDGGQLRYECIRVVCSPAATHFKYRRVRS
ncbi:MAG TPA: hypothetical protein VF713_04575 [Thermoanaerobaculia bacterium]